MCTHQRGREEESSPQGGTTQSLSSFSLPTGFCAHTAEAGVRTGSCPVGSDSLNDQVMTLAPVFFISKSQFERCLKRAQVWSQTDLSLNSGSGMYLLCDLEVHAEPLWISPTRPKETMTAVHTLQKCCEDDTRLSPQTARGTQEVLSKTWSSFSSFD